MSRFLTYLNVNIDSNTPNDIIQGGKLIDGLQMIYEDLPEGSRKDMMASTIADMAQLLMRKINQSKGVTNPKVEEELEEIENAKQERQEQETRREVEQMEKEPNPVDDTSLDEVDPPIEREPVPTEVEEETDTDLQDLINTIHNLEF